MVERINGENNQWDILGFIDKKSGDGIIGDDGFLLNYRASEALDVVIAVGDTRLRESLYQVYKKNLNLRFPTIIDPSVVMSETVTYGKGNIICAGSVLTVDILMGDFNIINLDCTIGHEVKIDDFVTINPSVNVSGNSHIETLVNIGTGSQVLQGMTIGTGSTIGGGTVVNKDIPRNCTAVGVPAKVIKQRDEANING